MGVLFFIFACIGILAAVSLHISFSIQNEKTFDKVIRFFLILVMIHVLHAFLVRLAPYEYRYIDRAAPFGLLYGPLLYFAFLTSKGGEPSRKTVLFHVFPFIIAIPFYIFFLSVESFRTHKFVYYSSLYGLIALSWLSYSSWMVYNSTSRKHQSTSMNKELPMMAVVILFTLSFYLLLIVSTRTIKGIPAESITSSLMIFIGMLGSVLYVYLYLIRKLKLKMYSLISESEKSDEDTAGNLSYLKSGVQADDIDEYARKVNEFLSSKKYLNPNFNLNKMSSELKIPKHHLSQVFNQYYGQSFLKYINSLRVMHACQLLEDPNLVSNIDDLVEQCGFNSKASFYRNFREIAKMTPTEFLNRSKKEE